MPHGTKADWHQWSKEVHDLEEGLVIATRKQPLRDDNADQSAVERHPALPYLEYLQRIVEQRIQVIEQHIAEAPAD
jgi:hypothetical protein